MMGDADEAAVPLKGLVEDVSLTPENIEVVNLSCQMTSMGLLPQPDQKPVRNGKKRVRFSLPDTDEDSPGNSDTVATTSYRRRETGEFLTARRRLPNLCLRKLTETTRDTVTRATGIDVNDIDIELAENEEPFHKHVKRKRHDGTTNVNCNCSTKGETSRRKNESDGDNSKSDNYLSTYEDKKGKKKVVSKKNSVKDDTVCCVKCDFRDKRKVIYIMRKLYLKVCTAKRHRVSPEYSKKKGKPSITCLNNSSLNQMCDKVKVVRIFNLKVGVKSYRVKQASASVKKANEKLKRAKEINRKRLFNKANEKKKALKGKADLQCKIAQKHKDLKMAAMAKRKRTPEIRPRKLRIIPIKREEDVSEDLRVNLLKFRTFEKAYTYRHECCRHYCWDTWEEVDIDDVLADFD